MSHLVGDCADSLAGYVGSVLHTNLYCLLPMQAMPARSAAAMAYRLGVGLAATAEHFVLWLEPNDTMH